MNKTAGKVLLILLILAGFRSRGQVQDAGLWLNVSVNKRITPALSVSFTQELRMNENITEAGAFHSDLDFTYRFGKHFRIGAGYRFSKQRRVDDSYDCRHRYNVDLSYREKIQRFLVNLRLRYESQYTDIYSSPEGTTPKNTVVPRLEVKYNLPGKFEPFIYGEPYFRVSNFLYVPFVQLRLCAGVNYSINRMHSVDLYYLFQKEYYVKHPLTEYVIGAGYTFSF